MFAVSSTTAALLTYTLLFTTLISPAFAAFSSQHAHQNRRHHRRSAATTTQWDKATSGTPPSEFAGSSDLPVAALAKAALTGKQALDSYLISDDSATRSTVYGDWTGFSDASAYYFTADMDVDCDGRDSTCKGNPDGQRQTDWGALAAYQVPWIVMPDSFVSAHSKQLPGNNLAAVICNGQLFYGILGDTNGDSPQVTGEASWVLSRACFPEDNLSGSAGHTPKDVTYIVFDKVFSGVDGTYITDFGALRALGDSLVGTLASHLKLS